MNEAEENENYSFNFLDFVDHELEDTEIDQNLNSFVELEFISDDENELENFNQMVISIKLFKRFAMFVARKLAFRT